jgi:SAM-dependent methyltransferase
MNGNIAYQTDELVRYFARNRLTWAQFYDSERVVIDALGLDHRHSILDIGCGCGGLGLTLRDRFGVENYTGVEINRAAADAGRVMNPNARIVYGDIMDVAQGELSDRRFTHVFSLSCVDWNVRFADMLAAAWNFVAPGGHLVATFRLVTGNGCNDINRSYQFINFEGVREGERASYVVLNAAGLIRDLVNLSPADISAYGYWGPPSATAVTPYERLCFCAVSVGKRNAGTGEPRIDLRLPPEILDAIESP